MRSNNQPTVFMRKLLFLSLLSVTLFSCKSKTDNGPMVLQTREVDYKDKTADEIKAQPFSLQVPGIQDLVVHDSLLIFMTSDPEGMLKVYNKSTLQPIASFCTRGRAANEFPGQIFRLNIQQYQRNGDLILPVMDNSTFIQKEVNVSASLREGRTVIEQTMQRTFQDFQSVVLNNGLEYAFMFYNPFEDELRSPGVLPLPVYAVTQNNKIVKEIPVFKEHVQSESLSRLEFFYNGQLLKHPDRNLVVMTMSTLDYILFFDIDKGRNFAIHQKGTPTAADVYVYNDWSKNPNCGSSSPMHIPGTDLFMCICASGQYTEQTLKEDRMGVELLVFDYDGNYKGGVKVDRNIHAYSYDPETKTLYAANIGSEEIFTVPLGTFCSF